MIARLLAVMTAALLAAACGVVSSAHSPTPIAQAPAATGTPAPSEVAGGPTPVTPVTGDPAAVVRSTVTAGNPRLLPAYVPSGMTATITAVPASYEVIYTDDLHTRRLTLDVNEGANPPPHGSGGSQAYRTFRGARALYTMYDTTAPLSGRNLSWQEPGTWSGPKFVSLPGIEYFLAASGLTETEFFRVADSLQPVG